jgi:hypothetical protein
MPGDDDRRAEIEAVARALAVDNGWCYSPHFYRGLAEVARAALDRVRDARGGDEAQADLLRIRAALLEWEPDRARDFILDLTARRLWPNERKE